MKKIIDYSMSMKTMVVLTLIFAVGSAVATFVENDFGTIGARALVYNATWFEVLMVALGLNLLYNCVKYKMHQSKKFLIFVFHISFIFILVGAALTRYVGYEGMLHIREGKTNNVALSTDEFVRVTADKAGKLFYSEEKVMMSTLRNNAFSQSLDIEGNELEVRFKKFVVNAVEKVVPTENGKPMVALVVTQQSGPRSVKLVESDIKDTGMAIFALHKDTSFIRKPKVDFFVDGEQVLMASPVEITWFQMSDQSSGSLEAGIPHVAERGRLYKIAGTQFVVEGAYKSAKLQVQEKGAVSKFKNNQDLSAVVVDVSYKGQTREVGLFGKNGRQGYEEVIKFDDTTLSLSWGSKPIELPFSLKLVDFQLERYPGSSSPSSYASEVVLIDKKENIERPFRVYMNHTLDYQGFRFFQSSYDRDEKGTILSVNNDPGKLPTYFGYFLLTVGLFLNFFSPNSRFRKLANKKYDMDYFKKKAKSKTAASILLACMALFGVDAKAQATAPAPTYEDIIERVSQFDATHAHEFGKLIVQDQMGRMKPINTLSAEIVKKVSRSDKFLGLTPAQVFLGMMVLPREWQTIKIFRVKHKTTKKILGLNEDEKRFAFYQVFDRKNSKYLFSEHVEEANRKRPAQRGTFEKEILKLDEHLNIIYAVAQGGFFKVFPKIDDPENKWYDPQAALNDNSQYRAFSPKEKQVISSLMSDYFSSVFAAIESKDWSGADKNLAKIAEYQQKYGAAVYPPKTRINAEILYNKLNIFERLMPFYLFSGLILLTLTFVKLINPRINIEKAAKVVFYILLVGFIVHTAGLGLRWYVAQHAPWSDSYESMIYIGWAVALSGVLFAKQSHLALSTTAILAGIILFVSHLSWMDPQITNLVPVLKSYWLSIHVGIITASYGFLGLSCLLGFIALVFFIIINPKRKDERYQRIFVSIKESSRINEMSLIIGLSLLVVGNFLGGVWANESWGRYWGWDPKETWAWISILIYSIVIHLRFIKSLDNDFTLAWTSTVSFASIIMTYFGVNFYLSGMHSYAAGDPVPIPMWVYYVSAIVFITILLAIKNRNALKG